MRSPYLGDGSNTLRKLERELEPLHQGWEEVFHLVTSNWWHGINWRCNLRTHRGSGRIRTGQYSSNPASLVTGVHWMIGRNALWSLACLALLLHSRNDNSLELPRFPVRTAALALRFGCSLSR